LTGVAIYAMMQCLGEMATWLPLPGAVPQYCARYVDPALGFAVGWNNWISNSLTLCAEISAAAIVIGFWNDTINQAAWITLILALIICLNIFAVSVYGEAEFIFASVKIITIVGLLLLAFIIDLGGSPDQGRLGFRYWSEPWAAMKAYVGVGNTGRFAGLFATLVNAAFSYGGVEMVAVVSICSSLPKIRLNSNYNKRLQARQKTQERTYPRLSSVCFGVSCSSTCSDLLPSV
jgi:amino acid transporter